MLESRLESRDGVVSNGLRPEFSRVLEIDLATSWFDLGVRIVGGKSFLAVLKNL